MIHPVILYVGDKRRGQAFVNAAEMHDWLVYQPQTTMEALGLYITDWPDMVILDLDARPAMAAEVYHHLRSIQARPLLVLTRDLDWEVDEDVFTASPAINHYELMETVGDLLDIQPVLVPQF